jgi:hypothetical protein
MNNNSKVLSYDGFSTISYTAGTSLLIMGEPATYFPFDGLYGESLKGIGLPVSNKKLDGVIRRKDEKYKCEWNGERRINIRARNPQQFQQAVVTLVKKVSQDTFMTKLTPDVVSFITGKKFVKGPKGFIPPILATEELIICTLAEFALDKFHTLNGIELQCSFYEGGEVFSWKSKY